MSNPQPKNDGLKVLYDPADVTQVIVGMAEMMLAATPDNLCLVMILRGGVFTGMRLLEHLDGDTIYGFLGLEARGVDVLITSDLDFEDNLLRGKNVWIVNDIIDNGNLLKVARNIVETTHPASIRTVTLVAKEKPGREYKPDVFGLYAKENQFIVGCGMGLGELHRNLSCLCELIKG